MFHGDMQCQWMNIDTKEVFCDTISVLFQKYISYTGHINQNIKITDWYGWTDILCIEKCNVQSLWKTFIIGDFSLTISEETKLPCYDYNGSDHYILKPVSDIQLTDMSFFKIRRFYKDDVPQEYAKLDDIMIITNPPEYGYIIKTRSGFLNINNYFTSGL